MSRLVVRLRVAGVARPEWQAKTPGKPWRPIEDVFAELPGLWAEWSRVLEDPSRLTAAREEPTGVRVDVDQRGAP